MPRLGVDTHVSFCSVRSARRARSACLRPGFAARTAETRTHSPWRRTISSEQDVLAIQKALRFVFLGRAR
jgi:hypothetical protein